MTTSGTGLLFSVCFVAVIAAAVLSVGPLLEGRLSLRTVPAAGWIGWLAVAVPSVLQVPFPQVYAGLHRSASAVLDGRQWWRVATALVVQDGGIAGTVSNLVLLAVALLACLPLWGSRATVLTFVLVGVALNVGAVLLGAEDGGGNSGATLPLLASLPPLALAVGRDARLRGAVGLAITVGAASTLIVVNDGHGYAVAIGLLLGVVGIPYARSRRRQGLIGPLAPGPTRR